MFEFLWCLCGSVCIRDLIFWRNFMVVLVLDFYDVVRVIVEVLNGEGRFWNYWINLIVFLLCFFGFWCCVLFGVLLCFCVGIMSVV